MAPPVVLVLIGGPGAGKTTTAKAIMAGRAVTGHVLEANHPDGERNKKGDGVKKVGAGVVLDGADGLALLGRYAATHKGLKKPHMEGADRLAVGKEKGTWSHLLRPGVSALARYRLLVVDSCDHATLHPTNLRRAEAAGWEIRVRELRLDPATSRARCTARNFGGDGELTALEEEWQADFSGMAAALRGRFEGWDYRVCSQDDVLAEARGLLDDDAPAAAAAPAGAAAPAAAAPKKRAAAPAPRKAAKKPKKATQPPPAQHPAGAAALSMDAAAAEARKLFPRVDAKKSRCSLWNGEGRRVGKLEVKGGVVQVVSTGKGGGRVAVATAAEAVEQMRLLL